MWSKGFRLSLLANFTYWICFFFHVALYSLFLDRQGLDSTTIGNVLAVGSIGALGGRLVSGSAIDRFGAKPFIIFGGFAMAVLSPVLVMTNDLTLLYPLRIIFGFTVGMFTNATLAHVTYISAPQFRGRAVSWWGVMNNFANAIIPPVAVALWLRTSFPAAFSFGAIFAVGAGIVGILLPRAGSKPVPAPAGDFQTPVRPLTEAGDPIPLPQAKFRFLVRQAVFPGMVMGAVGFALAAFMSFAPLIAEDSGMTNPGLYLTVYAIANIIGQFTSGPISDRMGRPWIIVPGFVLCAAGMGILGVAPQMGLLIPFVFGLGTGSVIPGILAWAVDIVKPEEQALASSTVLIMWEMFVFTGTIFQGRMFDAGLGAEGFQTMAGLIFVSTGVYLIGRRVIRRNLVQAV
jgi:MFS family permease